MFRVSEPNEFICAPSFLGAFFVSLPEKCQLLRALAPIMFDDLFDAFFGLAALQHLRLPGVFSNDSLHALGVPLILLGVVALLASFLRPPKGKHRRVAKRHDRGASPKGNQSDAVETARFTARAVLNSSERRIYEILKGVLSDHFGPDAILLAQVSLGEILKTKCRAAFTSINARRVDFLITDGSFQPICAVEYHGAGHFGSCDFDRTRAQYGDTIKRTALNSAQIPLVIIAADASRADIWEHLASVSGRDRRDALSGRTRDDIREQFTQHTGQQGAR